MPNYNKSEHISSAIESVLSQTASDFELIVVDDASTDGSAKIVEEKSRNDSRVSLVRNQVRRGASHCRNVGIKLSRGENIALLDSDDVYAKNALEVKSRAMRVSSTPVVVYSDYWLLDANGVGLPHWIQKSCTMSGMIFKEFLIHGISVQANLMVPKAFFDEIGPFDESISWGEDTDMIFRLARRYPFKYLDEQLYGYRLYSGNTWNKLSSRQRLASKTAIKEKYFRENIGILDQRTRLIVESRLVESYFKSHRYWRAMKNSVSSPGIFAGYLTLILMAVDGRLVP